jgi:hypothetical protein
MKAEPAPRAPDPERFALPIAIWLGGKRRTLIGRLQLVGVLLLLGAVASIPLAEGVGAWLGHQALRKEWAIPGPACPQVAKISIAAMGAKPPPPFVYQNVAIAYQIGDVFCAAVPEGYFTKASYPVCQFDHPSAIQVTSRGRTVIFEPGIGHRATVTVRGGRPSCVMGGRF